MTDISELFEHAKFHLDEMEEWRKRSSFYKYDKSKIQGTFEFIIGYLAGDNNRWTKTKLTQNDVDELAVLLNNQGYSVSAPSDYEERIQKHEEPAQDPRREFFKLLIDEHKNESPFYRAIKWRGDYISSVSDMGVTFETKPNLYLDDLFSTRIDEQTIRSFLGKAEQSFTEQEVAFMNGRSLYDLLDSDLSEIECQTVQKLGESMIPDENNQSVGSIVCSVFAAKSYVDHGTYYESETMKSGRVKNIFAWRSRHDDILPSKLLEVYAGAANLTSEE